MTGYKPHADGGVGPNARLRACHLLRAMRDPPRCRRRMRGAPECGGPLTATDLSHVPEDSVDGPRLRCAACGFEGPASHMEAAQARRADLAWERHRFPRVERVVVLVNSQTDAGLDLVEVPGFTLASVPGLAITLQPRRGGIDIAEARSKYSEAREHRRIAELPGMSRQSHIARAKRLERAARQILEVGWQWPASGHRWTLTHLESGNALPFSFAAPIDAVVAAHLLRAIDWTKKTHDMDQVRAVASRARTMLASLIPEVYRGRALGREQVDAHGEPVEDMVRWYAF